MKTKIPINQILKQAVTAHNEGKFEEAEKLYRSILEVEPKHAATLNNLGIIWEHYGKFEEAEVSYRKAIEVNPYLAEAHSNLGNTLKELKKLDEAEVSCKKAIKLKPNLPDAYNTLGIVLTELKKLDEAEASCKKAIELKPDYAEAYNSLGVLLYNINSLDQAEARFRKAIELKPDYAEAYNSLGLTLIKIGKLEKAKTYYKKAIELKPDFVIAHYNNCQIKKFSKEDEHFFQMHKLSLEQNLTDDQHCYITFALAKASSDLNQLDKSFKYYFEANTIRKKQLNYDINRDIKLFEQLKKTHPSLKKNSPETTDELNKQKIIFIIGMPRSGTTLVEQIISSHSKVMGAGELEYVDIFGRNIALGISEINNNTLLDFKGKYIRKLNKLSNGCLMVTDKMPANFKYVGLIYSVFPDAQIIHVKRNAAATCWGNYIKRFAKGANAYSYNLDDLVTYYELYQDLMKFWEEQYSDRIYNLNYETLTMNQEDQTRKLIQHLDLEWEKECLAPQDNRRIILTASNTQVRQKIYQGSSQEWKKFKPFLNGVFNHLDD
jgi:Flp pilus assembly protein TadD